MQNSLSVFLSIRGLIAISQCEPIILDLLW